MRNQSLAKSGFKIVERPLLGLCVLVLSLTSAALGTASQAAASQAATSQASSVAESQWLEQTMSLADARHLLGRTGFGATPARIAELSSMSRAEAVQNIIDGLQTEPGIPMPAWTEAPAPQFWTTRAMSTPERQLFNRERDAEIVELRQWWANNMLQTRSPQTERLVLFWHDHFATNYFGVDRRSISIARQNQLFRQMATASYRDFLKAIIRDTAMLRYLDNQSNRKGKPNENLARELLELFTLGEGNYDEKAVKEAARALTGYGISETYNEQFQFQSYRHDFGEKELFGQVGHHDGDALIDIILQQPAAAEHLVERYWHAFVSDSVPPQEFITSMAAVFRQSDYDLLTLYSSFLRSHEFWNEENRLALIKSPATLLIGTARSLDYPKRTWTQIPSLHALLGMDLFAPPNVAGWSEGAAFISPGILLNRQLALQSINQNRKDQTEVSSNAMMLPTMTQQTAQASNLTMRVAGHFYQGAPNYKISLLGSEKQLLWESDVRTMEIGYDTEMFGEMRSNEQLAWQTVAYAPPQNLLESSHWAKVEFLNDAAGKTGDRNLFVESVSVDAKTYSSSGATQKSHCAPKNKRDSGNLYCAGNVLININEKPDTSVKREADYTASSASLLWGNSNKERLSAIIALEHAQTPDNYFHTLSFELVSQAPGMLEINIDTFSCWPECIENWPDCSLQQKNSDARRLIFPLDRKSGVERNCHYESIGEVERQLVNSLFASLPDLFDLLSAQATNKRLTKLVDSWRKRMPDITTRINSGESTASASPFVINEHYVKPTIERRSLPEPAIAINSAHAYAELLNSAGVSIPEMLIGGVSVNQFPNLQAASDLPVEQQLDAVFKHPVYQVY